MVEGLRRWTLEFRDPAIEREYQAEASRAVLRAYRLLFATSTALCIALALVDRQTAGTPANYRTLEEVRVVSSVMLLAVLVVGWMSAKTFARLRQSAITMGCGALLWSNLLDAALMPDPGRFDMESGPIGFATAMIGVPAAAAVLAARHRDFAVLVTVAAVVGSALMSRFPGHSTAIEFWYIAGAAGGLILARQIELAKRGEFLASRKLAAERKRSEDLLYNVLPEAIAERLKVDPSRIAEHFDEATVMFADIAGFTPLSASMAPAELVAILDEIFTALDEIAHRRGLEKIKTIGDAYMVVGGVPTPRADHLEAVAGMALEMRDLVARRRFAGDRRLEMRIGIQTGPVVAGVIGKKKLVYDLWGDTVNTASRMESLGEPGRVHVTSDVADRLGGRFELVARGTIDVKGKGPMQTWFLDAARAKPDVAA